MRIQREHIERDVIDTNNKINLVCFVFTVRFVSINVISNFHHAFHPSIRDHDRKFSQLIE